MAKKILVFGASSSKQSINKKFAQWAANQIKDVDVDLVDLNDFEMPIFNVDRESESGIPQLAHDFKQHIKDADAILISFAEHNGAYSTAFKNIFDWVSRIEMDIWLNKPMLLLATSPGGRGGSSVLNTAFTSFGYMNKNSVSHFSLPSFMKNFSEEKGITDPDLLNAFKQELKTFVESL
jgi:chromate reductase